MADDKISIVGTNIAEKASVIWNVADMLRGPFKPHEYGLVILPMTVVKRFHDCLLPTWQAVQDQYEKVKHLAVIDGFLTKASGYQFYNISKFTFDKLLADEKNIEDNFRDYLAGFSSNVQDVLPNLILKTLLSVWLKAILCISQSRSSTNRKDISDPIRLVPWIAVIFLKILSGVFRNPSERRPELISQAETLSTL